jgi:class 3 adenylate cyclase
LSLRIGISSGPVLAGIVGEKKFVYDVWGDPVFQAHDMMLASRSGSIRISSATHALLGRFFEVQAAGAVPARRGGRVDSFIITGIKKELSVEGDGLAPNEAFTAQREELKGRG